jgi:hypothetical protein
VDRGGAGGEAAADGGGAATGRPASLPAELFVMRVL